MALLFIVYGFVVMMASAKRVPPRAPGYTVSIGGEGACLSEINASREAAGLVRFSEPTDNQEQRLPREDNVQIWRPLCHYLLGFPKTTIDTPEEPFFKGTYAYLNLESETPDCSVVVRHIHEAFKNFSGLPPKKADGEDIYKKQDNVSLVALYNPLENATADCHVVTCKRTQVNPISGQPSEASKETRTQGATDKATGSALICITTPDVLEGGQLPFTQAQWDTISASIKSSACALGPKMYISFAAAVFGIASFF